MPVRATLEQFKRQSLIDRAMQREAKEWEVPKGIATELKLVEGQDANVREFIGSNEEVDHEGDTIKVAGWLLESFLKAGSFLWAHDSKMPGLAEVLTAFVQGKELRVRVRFPSADLDHPMGKGFGHTVMRMFDERIIRGVSVGFIPLKWSFNEERGGSGYGLPCDFEEQKLLELSAAPVPCNPGALMVAQSKGINLGPVVNWAETVRDADTGLWLPKAQLQGFLDEASKMKTQVQVPKTPPAPAPVPAPVPEVVSPDDTIQRAVDAETSTIDRMLSFVGGLEKRGRTMADGNDAKLAELHKRLGAFIDADVVTADPDPEPAPAPTPDLDMTKIREMVREQVKGPIDEFMRRTVGRVA